MATAKLLENAVTLLTPWVKPWVLTVTIHWKAVEQYLLQCLFVIQLYQSSDFGKCNNFFRSERVKVASTLVLWFGGKGMKTLQLIIKVDEIYKSKT